MNCSMDLKMKKIISYLLASLFLCSSTLLSAQETPHSLKEKFTHAQSGDFIVTSQDGNYSLLFIRQITSQILLLEEISVPSQHIDLKKTTWKNWVKEKAPGHTSWTLYEIDRGSGQLIECFSYSKNGWLYLDTSEQFLTRLFALPLSSVLQTERKKIGQRPNQNEEDRRSLWNPPMVVEGKKSLKPTFEVLKTQWPEDGSRLSLCFIELYFSKEDPSFPFPYWLEVHSPHYTFKMRTIDSGHGLVSAMQGPMPHRTPQILSKTQKGEKFWRLPIKTPSYFEKLHLFVIETTTEGKVTTSIPFTAKRGSKNEEMTLEIPCSKLKQILKTNHQYQWVLIPEGSADVYIESEEIFIWR